VVQSYQSGDMGAGILLTNSATESKWWRMAAGACDAVCFPTGRVRFLKMRNGALSPGGSSPSHPHTLFYFGPDPSTFAKVLARFGLVFPNPSQSKRRREMDYPRGHHRCRVCHESSPESDSDMIKLNLRHWKHWECLTPADTRELKPGDERRFDKGAGAGPRSRLDDG
jgi:hypothetical protein